MFTLRGTSGATHRNPRLYWGIPLSYVDCTSASGVWFVEGCDLLKLHMANWPKTPVIPLVSD